MIFGSELAIVDSAYKNTISPANLEECSYKTVPL